MAAENEQMGDLYLPWDPELAVAEKGFAERQARFLTTVMLHAGVCVHASTLA